ncbi:MAG TPA: SDR family oxidoreductase [Spirochaetia bacterium]|nr:SDR family oxidoreductase [Spirochaetia bacterium]
MKLDVTKLFDLSGKRAAITGGGGELCGTMAEALAGLGVKVAILDIDPKAAQLRQDTIAASGGAAKAFACNVLDEADLERCYSQVCELWGGVDLLINGAGGNSPKGSTEREFLEFEELTRDDLQGFFNLPYEGFRKTFDLNFFGTFLPSKIFTKGMAERRSGSIVNVSSMSAFSPLTKVGAYSAAKAAVANFTKWLAVHFSHVGVRVNAIAPGFFMTEQLRFLHIDETTGEYTPRAKKVVAHTPMGRYGEPEELLGTVIWLLSEGSKFVTGNVVPIDGGFSSYSV